MTLFRYLLTDDGEDEVVVGIREEAPLGSALAEADAREPSGRDAHQRLDVLVAGVLVVGPRVEEREDARPPVGRPQGEPGGGHRACGGEPRQDRKSVV